MTTKTVVREERSIESPKVLVSINPSTEEEQGRVAAMSQADIDKKMTEARKAYHAWSQVPIRERQKLVERLNRAIVDQGDEIATLI